MIGCSQVSNGLSLLGVGVVNLAVEAPTFYNGPVYRTQFDEFLLTILNISPILVLEQLFCYRYHRGGNNMLRKKEEELMKIIRENDKPEQAAIIAVKVFAAFLAQLEADQGPQIVCLQESS